MSGAILCERLTGGLRRAVATAAVGVGLFACGGIAAGEDLGRLFTTPEQRAKMDNTFSAAFGPMDASYDEGAQLRLNGVIRGSDGRRAIWLNERQLAPGDTAVLLHDGRVRLQWNAGRSSRLVKPGQRVDKSTGRLYEPYDRALGVSANVEASAQPLARPDGEGDEAE